jgi:hypothetical protein
MSLAALPVVEVFQSVYAVTMAACREVSGSGSHRRDEEKLPVVQTANSSTVFGRFEHRNAIFWLRRGAAMNSELIILHFWFSGGADEVMSVIALTATGLLAVLGVVLTLVPLKKGQRRLKMVYLVLVPFLAVIGIIASARQKAIEDLNQNKYQQEERDSAIQFSKDLKNLTNSSTDILNTLAHPPKGFSHDQVISMVDLLLKQRQANSAITSEGVLRAIAPGIVEELNRWAKKWMDDDNSFEQKLDLLPDQGGSRPEASAAQKVEWEQARQAIKGRRADMNRIYTDQIRPLMRNADYLRKQLLGDVSQSQGDKESALIFDKVMAGQDTSWGEIGRVAIYMNNLVKQRL